MQRNIWLLLFALALIGDLVAIQFDYPSLVYVCKPLLIVGLALYFISHTSGVANGLKKWILTALFFSWAGDILLMFETMNANFFLAGLSCFLLAHIFYIVFFHRVRIIEGVRGNPWFLVIIVIYYALLIALLSPGLGDMKLPVRIYGIVISFMFMLSLHMLSIKNRIAGQLMMWGALLFVVSDSLLAINKFYHSFAFAGVLVMFTYGLAQLFITMGAVKYIRNSN